MYTLTLTEKQAQVIQQALEVFSRLGIGQVRMALEALPLKKDQMFSREDENAILSIIERYVEMNRSMGNQKTSESSKAAWDLYQVMRHRLSHDHADKMGWTDRSGCNYDEPFKTSVEPLAKINGTCEVRR